MAAPGLVSLNAASPARATSTPARRWLFAGFAVLGASGAGLLVSEGVLRVRERLLLSRSAPTTWAGDYLAYLEVSHTADRMFVRDPADRLIPYRNRPGFQMEVELPSGKIWSCLINSRGFRGPEFSTQKPAGGFRVLCLGGSTTFWGYSDRETYPALLEARLREVSGTAVEVLNLGVSGYTSAMNAERFLREYRSFEPDLVVVYEGINDISTLSPSRYRQRIGHSLALATAWNLAAEWLQRGEGDRLADAVAARFDREIAPGYDALRSAGESCGARLLACTFPGPDLSHLRDDERGFLEGELYRSWRELGSLEGYRAALDRYNQKLGAWAAARGVAVADLGERICGTSDIFMDLCHMNTEGLDRVAGEVAREVLARGWLPGAARRPRPLGPETVRD
jgi:lysophospholipase L1-like esterase